VSGNGLMALGPESEERHRVAAAEPTHCEVGGGSLYKLLQRERWWRRK